MLHQCEYRGVQLDFEKKEKLICHELSREGGIDLKLGLGFTCPMSFARCEGRTCRNSLTSCEAFFQLFL
jgi:hypothetical protein